VISENLSLDGCILLRTKVNTDDRGLFVKPFDANVFSALGLDFGWKECFWSKSFRGTIRGLHAQLPPAAHAKCVWPVVGRTFSVLLDLRRNSTTYGKAISLNLDANSGSALYVPVGVAHGFQALCDETTVCYLVTSSHAPSLDSGVRWDSVGVSWPLRAERVSARDSALPRLDDFKSPFL
jgi:dTDP-4-dehydrorhamnose 3,5-epimerase